METTTHAKNGPAVNKGLEAVEAEVENVQHAIQERVEQAGDIVEDLRDRAEMVLHERPYLLPMATGAVGLGVGILIGSKLSRMLVLGAAAALMNDAVRKQVVKMGKEFITNLSEQLDAGEDIEEPATTD